MIESWFVPGEPIDVEIGDCNNDGLNDIIFSEQRANTVTIYFWLQNSSGQWELNSTDSCINCSNYSAFFQKNFTYLNVGSWNFTINASDTSGFSNTTGAVAFTVEKDDVLLMNIIGNNTLVNRSSGSALLGMRIYDSDALIYTTGVNTTTELFTYIHNGTDWREEEEELNATHVYLNFDPDCNFTAGQRYWKMNIFSRVKFNIYLSARNRQKNSSKI
jgi:hypothetical protein